jgi:hypothetical protein
VTIYAGDVYRSPKGGDWRVLWIGPGFICFEEVAPNHVKPERRLLGRASILYYFGRVMELRPDKFHA